MIPQQIEVRGARVHNLKNIDVNVPLHKIVAIAGVSGSGKSSLALGVLYSEGSRRYLESLATYTRRRMTHAERASVDEVLYVPAALALRQRPNPLGIRSTFGTGTELLNHLRLFFSRLGSHRCPNGHYLEPSVNVAAERPLTCPECGAVFFAPGAEELAFNSQGACKRCDGVGIVMTVDESTLVPDESLSIDEGAVAPWQTLMWSLMKDIARDLGVRTDVPFAELTPKEREIVFYGPPVKRHMVYQNKTNGASGEMDFTYFNATYTVENALSKVKDEKGMKRVEKFLRRGVCPECHGTRLSEQARAPLIGGMSLADVCQLTLGELTQWFADAVILTPTSLAPMAESIYESFQAGAKRLIDLGLSYLSLDRAASTLSTGERQRMQLARAVRNRTTGTLYVLDEPSIGLHPSNLDGLMSVMRDLVEDGNSVVLVDHDVNILNQADWLIELGPDAGVNGGRVITQGVMSQACRLPDSRIGPYLTGNASIEREVVFSKDALWEHGKIHLETLPLHTVKELSVDIPKGRMTVVTGVSGSGKTTLVLESLVPASEALIKGERLPEHIAKIDLGGIRRVKLIDASPIGINVRSTVATYADVHDELRKIYARTPDAKRLGYKAGDFSYNTGKLRCPVCDGTGQINLDVQFLADVEIPCTECGGARYSPEAKLIKRMPKHGGAAYSLPELMDMSVEEALLACSDLPLVVKRLKILQDLGIGYLTLGEETPSLSGGEAQRLKLASDLDRGLDDSLFVFDEPTIGLHPLDVTSLLRVFERLVKNGATLVVIEHDLDLIKNADYIVDMGPGGGVHGGRIVAQGVPRQVMANTTSVTGRYLKKYVNRKS
ncbi:MAG: excinuclease ABC subunit UvrA [Planctomycetia bacterium]|nr:excinuclease ABC subunit UvrA [Planctomycetia bacterium]